MRLFFSLFRYYETNVPATRTTRRERGGENVELKKSNRFEQNENDARIDEEEGKIRSKLYDHERLLMPNGG